MRVLRAEAMGLCFGVRDALDAARAHPSPTDVTIWGELVHNEAVLAELGERGFAQQPEARRDATPATPAVMITAHGVSDRERQRLLAAGKQIVDTTCPLVTRVHRVAQRLATEGRHVIVLGKPGHVEVRGIAGDLPRCSVVASESDVAFWPEPRLGIVCQTTFPLARAHALRAAIEARNPHADVVFADTVCEPTKQRILAAERLATAAEVVIVVGGRRSNNTLELVRLCQSKGARVFHVQVAADLDPAWLAGCEVVGLTAGTSTPDATIDAVEQALLALATMPEVAR